MRPKGVYPSHEANKGRTCKGKGCGKGAQVHGYCNACWKRVERHGDTVAIRRPYTSDEDRQLLALLDGGRIRADLHAMAALAKRLGRDASACSGRLSRLRKFHGLPLARPGLAKRRTYILPLRGPQPLDTKGVLLTYGNLHYMMLNALPFGADNKKARLPADRIAG